MELTRMSQTDAPDTAARNAVGRLAWYIVDSDARVVAGSGDKTVTLEDFHIEERRDTRASQRASELYFELTKKFNPNHLFDPELREKIRSAFAELYVMEKEKSDADSKPALSSPLFSKTILLDNVLRFGLADRVEETRKGFGFFADLEDRQTFSWEWFKVSGVESATKLQETGGLRITVVQTANGLEIGYTGFETDVSIRLDPIGEVRDPLNPKWRVNIAKGSEVYWPSLIEGKIIFDGELVLPS